MKLIFVKNMSCNVEHFNRILFREALILCTHELFPITFGAGRCQSSVWKPNALNITNIVTALILFL